jgi:hypothetical protein
MRRASLIAALLLPFGGSGTSFAALSVSGSFNPSQAADLCGVGLDPTTKEVWVYGCSEGEVERYSRAGAFGSSVPRPGEVANDVDVELASKAFTLGSTPIPKGALLFINGETGPAEVYAVDKTTGAVLATLNTAFGISHVVGGAYHRDRNTLFLVQDLQPAAADENRIAEIDPTTGAILNNFQFTATFSVNFGDLDVCASTGNLLVVSSVESRIAEYTPAGAFVAYHDLPAGVTSLSGIGIDDTSGEIWVSGTTGTVWSMTSSGGVPCASAPEIPVFPGPASGESP